MGSEGKASGQLAVGKTGGRRRRARRSRPTLKTEGRRRSGVLGEPALPERQLAEGRRKPGWSLACQREWYGETLSFFSDDGRAVGGGADVG